MPFCRSGSGLVAPVRARGLAGRGLIGACTSVRRDLIGRILCVPTGVCCRGDWEWQRNSRRGKRGRGCYKVVHTDNKYSDNENAGDAGDAGNGRDDGDNRDDGDDEDDKN